MSTKKTTAAKQPKRTKGTKGKTLSFYLSPTADAAIRERAGSVTSSSAVLERIVDRYLELVQSEAPEFSAAEWSVLREALQGCWNAPAWAAHAIAPKVADTVRQYGLDKKYGVDWVAVYAKLVGLTYAQTLAVLDAVEVWWADQPE